MVHVISVEVRRFYRCYVEDEACRMTDKEALQAAAQMISEDPSSALTEDLELDQIEPDDVLSLAYEYSFDN